MKRFVESWDGFFHRSVPPHALALVRIAFGLFLMLYWTTQRSQQALFSSEGVTLPLFGITAPSIGTMHVIFSVLFFWLIAFTIGYRSRIAALMLVGFFFYFDLLGHWQFIASFYRLFGFMLLVFTLPGADATFSLTAKLKHGSWFAWEPISILPQRLLALQTTFTYFAVGWQKLLIADWRTGEVLRRGFTGRWGTEFGFYLARVLPPWAFDWAVWLTVFFECLMPIGLWVRRLRPLMFLFGFVFHTLITVTMGIWWFQILVPLYVVFLSPEEVYGSLKKMSGGRIR